MSYAAWHVLRARAEQARRNLEEAEELLDERYELWTRHDAALDRLNTEEDALGADTARVLDQLLVEARRALEACDDRASRTALVRIEAVLRERSGR